MFQEMDNAPCGEATAPFPRNSLSSSQARPVLGGGEPDERTALLERALDASTNGVLITDARLSDNPILFANPGFAKMTGYQASEIMGRNCRFLQGPDTDPAQVDQIRAAIREERPCHVVIRNYKKDGTAFWNDLSLSPVRDTGGRLTHFIGVQTDVTEQRLCQEMKAARAYAESIVDTVREPLLILDGEDRVVSANRSFYQTFQVGEKETTGERIQNLGNGQWNRADLRKRIQDIRDADTRFENFEVEHVFPGIGSRTMLLNARKVYRPGNHSEMVLLAIEDVTGQKQAQAERQKAEDALRASEQHFRGVLETIHLFAVILDARGAITFCNDFLLGFTGYERDAVAGQDWFDRFVPRDQRDRSRQLYRNNIAEQTMPAHRESDILTWHGLRHLISWNDLLLHDGDGAVVGVVSVGEDITRRRQSEVQLAADYEREKRTAEALQSALLLTKPPETYPDLATATFYQASGDEAGVGGDFFDTFALEGGKVALVVGDASGKGLAAAVRTAEVKFALRAFLRAYEEIDLARTMSRLNQFVFDFQHLDKRGWETFIVLSLAVVDPQSGAAWFSTAGAEAPLVLRAGGEAVAVAVTGLPLGVERTTTYAATSLHMDKGDVVLLATDGITEARCGRSFLGYEGMVELAQQASNAGSLQAMGKAILDGARGFADGRLHDDACLLLATRR